MSDEPGAPDTTDPDGADPSVPGDGGPRTGVLIGIGAVVVIAALIVAIVFLTRGDDDGDLADTTEPPTTEEPVVTEPEPTEPPEPTDPPEETTTTTTTTTEPEETTTTTEPEETTTTTEPEETTTTLPPGPTPEEVAAAVWPWAESDVRYDEPLDAVEGFVIDYLELGDPTIGEFMQGDANSGEFEVRSGTFVDPTVVSVRRFSDGTWWVLGSATRNIVVDQPEAGDEIDSPLVITGESTAPEATVQVEIRLDGSDEPLLDDFYSGGGSFGEMAPFEATFEWDPPEAGGAGALVLSTFSSQDGTRAEATVLRVTFPEN